MSYLFKKIANSRVGKILKERFEVIAELNRKYSVPRLKTTPFVRLALLLLRIYLLLLVIILVYKFITLIHQ